MSDEQPATNMTADEAEQTIAKHLGETEAEPLKLLHKVVKKLGPEQALAFLKETQEIEAQGGLLLPDGSRRRTPGASFSTWSAPRHPSPCASSSGSRSKRKVRHHHQRSPGQIAWPPSTRLA
jgi:hypothetical protein